MDILRKSFVSGLLVILAIVFMLYFAFLTGFVSHISSSSNTKYRVSDSLADFQPLYVVENELNVIKQQKLSELLIIEKEAELQRRIAAAEKILAKYNSPFVGLGEIIVRRADECGGDYRLLLAIAGNESGFGRIPYKSYNPFGYLNGVQYASWEESLDYLSCKISTQHLAPCNNDVSCVVVKYGGSDTDKEKWVKNIYWFMGQIE